MRSEVIKSATDRPATKDALGVTDYVHALSRFVQDCQTPMTIAIQGDWGSGKTSLMNLMRDEVRQHDCHVVEFNTWQYSQFNMGDDLVLALMEHLIDAVGKGDKDDEYELRLKRTNLKRALFAAAKSVTRTLTSEASKMVPFGTPAFTIADNALSAGQAAYSDGEYASQYRGRTAVVDALQQELQSYVNDAIKARKGTKRVVVLIDDLDRLPPQRAVEVMEALKVFLDLQNCVYVLAIDFDVVKQGVRKKFGDQFDDRKAIAFFDKIIQVPFHMPVDAYQVDGFLSDALGIPQCSADAPAFIQLAKNSVGNNPRSLKRLANTFQLLKSLRSSGAGNDDDHSLIQLFAVLCLQSAYPLFYQDFIATVLPLVATDSGATDEVDDIFEDYASLLAEMAELRDPEDPLTARMTQWGIRTVEALSLKRFLGEFKNYFIEPPEDELDTNALHDALTRAAVTSVGNSSEKEQPRTNVVHGFELVQEQLADRKVKDKPRELTMQLAHAVQERVGPPHFQIGVSSNKSQDAINFYVDRNNQKRGRFCEITLNKGSITIRFASDNDGQVLIDRVHDEARKNGFELGRKDTTAYFKIALNRVTSLDNERLQTIVDWLQETHSLTRARYFSA